MILNFKDSSEEIRNFFKNIQKRFEINKFPLLVFFSALFIFLSFAGTRLFFSDEGVILDQFYNLIHGSLALKAAKINTATGGFILVGDNLYGVFSYSLILLSVPVYYLLSIVDSLYGAHLFLLQTWALSGGLIVYLAGKIRTSRYSGIYGLLTILILTAANLYFFKPIYFPRWGELLSIELTNILISSLIVLVVFLLFRDLFGNKIGIFASFFIILATPISFYAVTLKHHSLTVLLTLTAFYFFYKFIEKKQNKFIYFAYILAGLCVWVRVLDGAVLLISLLAADLFIFRRKFKHLLLVSIIILLSLMPFFTFNYLVLGNPFSITETTPLTDKQVSLYIANDFISLDENPEKDKQTKLLDHLGFTWDLNIKANLLEVPGYVLFLKLNNTFGIFVFSPFLIIALAFIFERIKKNIKLNGIDMFFGIYSIFLLGSYSLLKIVYNIDALIYIITHTPAALEYRYLLILYIILLYFVFRIDRIRKLIEDKTKKIVLMSCIILIIGLIFFGLSVPVQFMNLYYAAAALTSITLLFMSSRYLLKKYKKSHTASDDGLLTFLIALALAEASTLLIFYFWIVNMTYISPSQNFSIVPVLESIIKLIYHNII